MTDDTEVDAPDELRRLAELVGTVREQVHSLREPVEIMEKALADRDELRALLREIRGELAGIRTRLDSLVGVERQLQYHGARLLAIERRFGTMVEMKFEAPPGPAA